MFDKFRQKADPNDIVRLETIETKQGWLWTAWEGDVCACVMSFPLHETEEEAIAHGIRLLRTEREAR